MSNKTTYPPHVEEIFQKLTVLRKTATCDVVLIACKDKHRVPCNRAVLSLYSKYLSALFKVSPTDEIKLCKINGPSLEKVVNFCYTGQILANEQTVADLLRTANLLQVHQMVKLCFDYIQNQINMKNCWDIAKFADQHDCISLKNAVWDFINDNFEELNGKDEIDEIDYRMFCQVLASNELRVRSESVVFDSVRGWIIYDEENREKHTMELLKLVRMPLMPKGCLDGTEPPVYRQALEWHLKSGNELIYRRDLIPKSFLAVFKDMLSPYIKIKKNCPFTDVWHEVGEDLLNDFGVHSFNDIAICSDELFLVHEGRHIYVVDLDTLRMTQVRLPVSENFDFSIAVLGCHLYKVGGTVIPNAVERYDPYLNRWIPVAYMYEKRSNPGLVALRGRLYAIGGKRNGRGLKSTESYEADTNQWTKRADMNSGRCNHGIAAGNGFVYVMGGMVNNNLDTCVFERYDPRNDTWTQLCHNPLIHSGRNIDMTFFVDHLRVLIPKYPSGGKHEVYKYYPETNTWSKRKSKLIQTDIHFVVITIPNYYNSAIERKETENDPQDKFKNLNLNLSVSTSLCDCYTRTQMQHVTKKKRLSKLM